MNNIHNQILNELRKTNPTLQQLSAKLQRNHNGIRGRISELRKNLPNETITTINQHYSLQPKPEFFLERLRKQNFMNRPLSLSQLSHIFNTTPASIEHFLSSHFNTFHITQLSPDTVSISY